jgi:hypothetical protein
MTRPDLAGRTPTVQRYRSRWWPLWQPRRAAPAPEPARKLKATPEPAHKRETAPEPPRRVLRAPRPAWLFREAVALIGMAGAALTVFSQLTSVVPLSPPFVDVLGWWVTVTLDFWLALSGELGFYVHSHIQAAIALAVFLTMIGLGARIAAILSRTPLERRWEFLDGMTWPSAAILGVLGIVFLLGHDVERPVNGGKAIQYTFAIILTAGYALGNHLGQRGFHIRLYRLAALLALLVALNFWLLPSH